MQLEFMAKDHREENHQTAVIHSGRGRDLLWMIEDETILIGEIETGTENLRMELILCFKL